MPSSSSSSSSSRSEESASTSGGVDVSQKEESPFYCPGCGKRVDYQQQCTGRPDSPHPPIEVVSTNELTGPEAGFTAAPNTGT